MTVRPQLRAAHAGLVGAFLAFGIVDGTWSARLPAFQHRLRLDSGELGIVVFAVSATATAALPAAGWLTGRRGSRGPAGLGLCLAAAALVSAAFAPGLAALVPAACVLGAGFGIVDVAVNAHGVALERRLEKPLLSGLHGAWSFGLLGGSGIAAGAAAAGAGPRIHFPAVAAGAVAAAALAVPRLLPGTEEPAADVAHFSLARGVLALPAVLTFCAMFVESASMSWSAVFLAGPAHAGATVAAGGVAAFAVAMALVRLGGDSLTVRWGAAGLTRRGGALSCAGMLLALATRSPLAALAGFAAVGAGCAATVPVLFRLAAAAPGLTAGAGIAAVATAGYTGGVVSGPAIGFLARGVGLTLALGLAAAASGLLTLLAPRLEPEPA